MNRKIEYILRSVTNPKYYFTDRLGGVHLATFEEAKKFNTRDEMKNFWRTGVNYPLRVIDGVIEEI